MGSRAWRRRRRRHSAGDGRWGTARGTASELGNWPMGAERDRGSRVVRGMSTGGVQVNGRGERGRGGRESGGGVPWSRG